jgi:HSP20 family protein
MNPRRQSFLERLTGTTNVEYDEPRPISREREFSMKTEDAEIETEVYIEEAVEEEYEEENSHEGEIGIDMYDGGSELVIHAMIAGVTPENLHISITRDTVLIRGKRNAPQGVPDSAYINQELYWGSFVRTIELPYEIDTDNAEAVEKFGLLIVRLPKLDVGRSAQLKVKSI